MGCTKLQVRQGMLDKKMLNFDQIKDLNLSTW
jgi:hypothetical protein